MTGGRDAHTGCGPLGSELPIGEQCRYCERERIAIRDSFRCTSGCQISRHSGAIANVGPMQHGAVQSGRLEWVMTALGNQRSADEGDPGKTVEEPELAHRVSGVTASRRARRAVRKPRAANIAAIASPRAE